MDNEQRAGSTCDDIAWGQATFGRGGSVTHIGMVYEQQAPHVRVCERGHIRQQPVQRRMKPEQKQIFPFVFLGESISRHGVPRQRPRDSIR
uniref:Uncharacterized protein n=1 Tax=Arundo donax TaxID=35708 RepID=A0A0A9H2D3_ARUDO